MKEGKNVLQFIVSTLFCRNAKIETQLGRNAVAAQQCRKSAPCLLTKSYVNARQLLQFLLVSRLYAMPPIRLCLNNCEPKRCKYNECAVVGKEQRCGHVRATGNSCHEKNEVESLNHCNYAELGRYCSKYRKHMPQLQYKSKTLGLPDRVCAKNVA